MPEEIKTPISAEADIAKAFEPSATSVRQMRSRLLLRLLLVSLTPLLLLFVYFHFQFRSTLEERSQRQVRTIAINHGTYVDRLIETKASALRSLAESDLCTFPPSKDDIQRLYKILTSLDNIVLDVGVFDDEGRHLYYAGPFQFLEGRNYGNEPWFKALSSSENPLYISDAYLGYRHEAHFIIAVRTEVEGRRWYVRMTINPTRFGDLVEDVQQLVGADAYLINRENVFQSIAPELGKPLSLAPTDMHPDSEADRPPSMIAEKGGYLLAFYPMESVAWTLVVRQPLKLAYAPAAQAMWVSLAILGFGIVFIVFASLLASTTLVRHYVRSERNRKALIDQLVQAGKMSTMGEMAAGVAHEINNPLAIIQSECGLMEDYLDPAFGDRFDRDEFKRRLRSIIDESNRCRSIIHKLLGFARRTASTIRDCDLNQLVATTVELVRKELSLENIEIVLDLSPELEPIQTDGEKIKQVLLNLIRNAADAIGKDGRITILTTRSATEISFIVSDTGSGISEENLKNIFLPFFTTKEVGKGTGLGLSISHGIVTSLGGRIGVTSQLGVGTSFEIALHTRNGQRKG